MPGRNVSLNGGRRDRDPLTGWVRERRRRGETSYAATIYAGDGEYGERRRRVRADRDHDADEARNVADASR